LQETPSSELATREYSDPWIYLHAIGEWQDVTAALESGPHACAVFGLSPLLIEELTDLGAKLALAQRTDAEIPQPLLTLLARPQTFSAAAPRATAIDACRRLLATSKLGEFPALARLHRAAAGRGAARLTSSEALDYFVWTHLAFMSEALRSGDPRVQALCEKHSGFDADDCRALGAAIADAVTGLLPRWRRLIGNGRLEIAALAYSGAPLGEWLQPNSDDHYPGGDDRARWQVARALQRAAGSFGLRPVGFLCGNRLPSSALASLLDDFGLCWAAATGPVHSSLSTGTSARWQGQALHVHSMDQSLWREFETTLARRGESGRECAAWIEKLAQRAGAVASRGGSLAICGPWRGARAVAPRGRAAALRNLFAMLASRADITLNSFSGLSHRSVRELTPTRFSGNVAALPRAALSAAHDALIAAKLVFDQVVVEGNLDDERQARAELQLARCESAEFLGGAVSPALGRQLLALYRVLDEVPPAHLVGNLFAEDRAA
jgi:hypothetical protein